jgi:predicted nucleic acid-binding protein
VLRAIDANIPIYAYVDFRVLEKTHLALRLMEELASSGECVVSTQVLKEFANVATLGRRLPALPHHAVTEYVQQLMRMRLVQVNEELVLSGVDRHFRSKISFYDALIVEAALRGGAEILYSEDLQHGQNLDGLRVINPFLI